MKKLYANCQICKKQITIEVPEDIAKDREYYPFEYIEIHGEPEHALMLFLDQNLAVRDAIAYQDIQIVKKKSSQYKNIVRMSETDAFASIYMEPLRLKIFMLLTEGPQIEENLISQLKKEEGFVEAEFNMLILPLIRTGLVKTKWLQDTFQMCYFLVADFSVLRIVPRITSKIFLEADTFKPYAEIYFKKLNETLLSYKEKILSGKEAQITETHLCLKVRSTLKYLKILNLLRDTPQPLEELLEVSDKDTINELINKGFVVEIPMKPEPVYALLTDILIKKFTPKYLTNSIAEKFNSNAITREMALAHLDFLYDAEISA